MEKIENFNFKKKFGQNFISDKNLISAIAQDAKIGENDFVLEIGAGAGSLTKELSVRSKQVVSYEIDEDLKAVLSDLNLKNVEFVFSDFLKENSENIFQRFEKYKKNDEKTAKKLQKNEKFVKVVANLPYYVTSPIIFKILEELNFVESVTCMVQKEVAERICAKCGGKDYGVLSAIVSLYGTAKITRQVKREMFFPQPNVDSAVLNIQIEEKFEDVDKIAVSQFIKLCFSMRRKTLQNNLSKKYSKPELSSKLTPEILSRRAESFSIEEFIEIFKKLEKNA